MKNVPVTWDETRFIEGYPGKYIVLARRHGSSWYIVGVNAGEEKIKLTVEIPESMNRTPLTLYSDDDNLSGKKQDLRLDKKGR